MEISYYQIDAFTDRVFNGNPAAVCPLNDWLPDSVLQAIAMENNQSETSFIVSKNDDYEIRWFTPTEELDLCGHGTLATAYVIFRWLQPWTKKITFHSRSGELIVHRNNDEITMDFPTRPATVCDISDALVRGLGTTPRHVLKADAYLAVFESERQIRGLKPDFKYLAEQGFERIIVTAPGDKVDFVSRYFKPKSLITEDPVTGAAHSTLMPYWARRVNKNRLEARQVSRRGGEIMCELRGDRLFLTGKGVLYLQGTISIPYHLAATV